MKTFSFLGAASAARAAPAQATDASTHSRGSPTARRTEAIDRISMAAFLRAIFLAVFLASFLTTRQRARQG
jgi:hypothetical protein